jgi:hypothetical protein
MSNQLIEWDEDGEVLASNRCTECGNFIQHGDELCGHCAAEGRDIEFAVNDYREER